MKNEFNQGDKVSVKVGAELYICMVSSVQTDTVRVLMPNRAMVQVLKSSVEVVR